MKESREREFFLKTNLHVIKTVPAILKMKTKERIVRKNYSSALERKARESQVVL